MEHPISHRRRNGASYGLGTLDENHPISLAPHEGQNHDLGEFEETWDGWTISVCDVSKG